MSALSVFRTCSGSAPRRTRPARPPAPPWTRPAWRSCRGRPGTPARCSTYSTLQYSTCSAVQYSTALQTHCNLSLFLTSGGRSEVLFLRQEGSGGDNQLEIYLWNVRAAQIVCIEIKYTPTRQIIILPPNLHSYLLSGVTPTNPSPSKLSGLETNRRLWASERRMSGTSSSRGGTEQRKMGANRLHDPILWIYI